MRELKTTNLNISNSPVTPEMLGNLISIVDSGKISGKIGKTVFVEMWQTAKNAETIIQEKGLVQISDPAVLAKNVEEVIAANPDQVAAYRAGKEKLFGFFVGAVMRASKGQANPDLVNQLLLKKLRDQK